MCQGTKELGDYNPDCKAGALLFKTETDEGMLKKLYLG